MRLSSNRVQRMLNLSLWNISERGEKKIVEKPEVLRKRLKQHFSWLIASIKAASEKQRLTINTFCMRNYPPNMHKPSEDKFSLLFQHRLMSLWISFALSGCLFFFSKFHERTEKNSLKETRKKWIDGCIQRKKSE